VERTTKHHLRSAATRQKLVDAARSLFGRRGYAGVGTEEIVHAAGVTRGALYHQFRDKAELFAAVVEAVEADMVDRITETLAATSQDPAAGLLAGADTFLALCAAPEVGRIILRDAPAVLDEQQRQDLNERYGVGLIQSAVDAAIAAGTLAPQPVAPLARLLSGALNEAARYVAAAQDQDDARRQCLEVFARMLDGLRVAR
jgi:AcrR family transcriptional regulator